MEFEGQYLTYDDYVDLGGTLDEEPFNLLEFEVRKILDRRTQRRLVGVKEMPQDVLVCMYKMISMLDNYSKIESNNKNIASENTDGYSVSYATTEQIIKSKSGELEDIMMNYLATTVVNGQSILYLGVR